ncbi:MAG: glycosyltransferase [bacterium]|nr:glycosyltransferase [bacterium]
MKIFVIIPTYNEKENIRNLIKVLTEEIFPKINNHEMGILVVDGQSPDGTGKVVEELSKKYPNVHLIPEPAKRGLGAAYIFGMTEAIEKFGAEAFFEFDADFSHDPKLIPDFIKKLDDGADFILGSRYIKGGSIPGNWGLHRKLLSVFGNLFINIVFWHRQIHDWTSGYRLIRKDTFLKIKERLGKFSGYTFQIAFLHAATHLGAKIAEVPLNFIDRKYGRSKMGTEYFKNALLYVVKVRFEELKKTTFFKFLMVGGLGFIINAGLYFIFARFFLIALWLANLVSSIFAVFSNFFWNNRWTFKERKAIGVGEFLVKLIKFYATSAIGVIFIQTGTIALLEALFGRSGYMIYFLLGTALLSIWNFTVYSKVIWRKKS